MENSKLHFVTFYSQGEPYDNALSLEKEKETLIDQLSKYVDSWSAISCHDLKSNPETEIYARSFQETALRNHKTNEIGFLRWKPYIILRELEKLDDGDIVFYRDCNVSKYKDILYGIPDIRNTINSILEYCETDFFAPIESFLRFKMNLCVKQEVFDYFNLGRNNENYLVNASVIIVRKSEQSVRLLKLWLEACMNDQLLSPNFEKERNPYLKWNTQEQAILNGLLIKENYYKKLLSWRGSRRLTLENLILIPKVALIAYGHSDRIKSSAFKKIVERLNPHVFYTGWVEDCESTSLVETSLRRHFAADMNTQLTIDLQSKQLLEQSDRLKEFKGTRVLFDKIYKIFRGQELINSSSEKYDLVIFLDLNQEKYNDISVHFLWESLNHQKVPNKVFSCTRSVDDYKDRIELDFLWCRSEIYETFSQLWLNIDKTKDISRVLENYNDIQEENLYYYYTLLKKIMYQPV
jgi:hypothetical protein